MPATSDPTPSPQTDAEFEAALEALDCQVIDHGDGSFALISDLGGATELEAANLSDALREAWNLIKP